VSTDTPIEQRLHTLYAVPAPIDLDRRIFTAMTTVPVHRSRRTRPRVLVALAVAAILAAAAAGPALEWFGGRDDPFAGLWEVSSPVDQSVTADGYRVTVHRAYADRLGVRLAMTVEDLENRWSSLEVEAAEATDSRGRVYEGWNWSGSRTPVDGSIAKWARFLLPDDLNSDDVRGDDLQLRVTVTSLWVRSPEPLPIDPDPEQIFTSVGGAWSFEFDMPPITQGEAITPVARASSKGVTIELAELGVVPSGTVVRLAVDDLPEGPSESLYGWLPDIQIEHDGEPMGGDQPLEPGIVGSDGVVTIEAFPDVEELAGHWRITVYTFYAADHLGQGSRFEGPWALEFDVPAAS
jgi:Domain of unknown function (DUF4179)